MLDVTCTLGALKLPNCGVMLLPLQSFVVSAFWYIPAMMKPMPSSPLRENEGLQGCMSIWSVCRKTRRPSLGIQILWDPMRHHSSGLRQTGRAGVSETGAVGVSSICSAMPMYLPVLCLEERL